MAIITGFTAEKMNEFNNASVIGGAVNSAGSLILKTRGGTEIDAGSVKGPKGDNDAEILKRDYVPRWKPNTVYSLGDQVIPPAPANTVVTALKAHTSSTSFFADIVSNWNVSSFSGTTADRNVIFPTPSTDEHIVALANRKIRFYNQTEGWWECYYSPQKTGLTAKPLIAGNNQGWYPDSGTQLLAHRGIHASFSNIPAATDTAPVMGDLLSDAGGRFVKSGNSGIQVPFGGFYRINASLYATGGASSTVVANVRVNNVNTVSGNANKSSTGDTTATANTVIPIANAATISLFGWSTEKISTWGTTGYDGTRLTIEYDGPPLTNLK